MSTLRHVRVDRHLTVAALSERSHVSQEQIRNIEAGRARNPRVDTLAKLAAALEVKPSAIDPMLETEKDAA